MSMKQKEISQFYEKILPESQTCKENRNNTTPSTSSQMKEKNLPKKNQIMQNFLDNKASKNTMKLQLIFVKHSMKTCANFA